jgi:hypothetical protein
MAKSLRIAVILLLFMLSLALMLTPNIFSQGSSGAVKEVSGAITSIDAQTSRFSVQRVIDQDRGLAENIVITANQSTVIKKGQVKIAFSDLQIGQEVSVSYSSTLDDKNIAQSISIK